MEPKSQKIIDLQLEIQLLETEEQDFAQKKPEIEEQAGQNILKFTDKENQLMTEPTRFDSPLLAQIKGDSYEAISENSSDYLYNLSERECLSAENLASSYQSSSDHNIGFSYRLYSRTATMQELNYNAEVSILETEWLLRRQLRKNTLIYRLTLLRGKCEKYVNLIY